MAYFTLAERKILGAIQRRMGPNVIGVYGLLQPLSDGFKLLMKETKIASKAMIVDVNVIENENCYPMMTPGRSNSQMLGLDQATLELEEIKLNT